MLDGLASVRRELLLRLVTIEQPREQCYYKHGNDECSNRQQQLAADVHGRLRELLLVFREIRSQCSADGGHLRQSLCSSWNRHRRMFCLVLCGCSLGARRCGQVPRDVLAPVYNY